MNPATHFLLSWSLAGTCDINKRERLLVTVAGIAPDFDAAGLLLDLAAPDPDRPLYYWSEYHHVLGHNLGFGLLVAIVVFALSTRRRLATVLALAAFHLHLVCDLIGARGPDGFQWPIPYLLPFSNQWQWVWSGQWALNAWQNVAITCATLLFMFYHAWRHGVSPLEMISGKANAVFVDTLRTRFGTPRSKQIS